MSMLPCLPRTIGGLARCYEETASPGKSVMGLSNEGLWPPENRAMSRARSTDKREGAMARQVWMRALLGGSAAALVALASPAAAAECGDLASMNLPGGKVTAATVVGAGAFQQPGAAGAPPGVAASRFGELPAFCRVQLTLTPSTDSDIKAEVWLPISGWNGKYVGIGNGIWAGSISYGEIGSALARGYAAAATDTGHTGNGMTGEFAVGHPEKLVDFGHRAVHETTVAAKRVVEAFYGSGPKLSFWNSCSTGGRQGLMAAYRYPADFDAISAMAPANR